MFAWLADLLMVSFLASKSSSSRIYEGSERRMGEVGENWRLKRWPWGLDVVAGSGIASGGIWTLEGRLVRGECRELRFQ